MISFEKLREIMEAKGFKKYDLRKGAIFTNNRLYASSDSLTIPRKEI